MLAGPELQFSAGPPHEVEMPIAREPYLMGPNRIDGFLKIATYTGRDLPQSVN